MPPLKPPVAAAPAAVQPTDAELRKALEAENVKLREEGQSYLNAARSEWQRAEDAQAALRGITTRPPANAPVREDPFQKLAQEGIAVSPEEQARLLDAGSRMRTRDELGRYDRANREERLAENYQLETKLALSMFRQAHPELAADPEGFAASLTRAQIRARQSGQAVDPVTMLSMAHAIYNEGKAPDPQVPFVEGVGAPGGPMSVTTAPGGPKPKNIFEQLYGAKDVVDASDPDWSMDGMTEKYLDARNLDLVKEGFHSRIGQVMAQIEEARQRASAAA